MDHLSRLVARGYERDVGDVREVEGLYSVDNVDYGAAAADANVLSVAGKVLVNGDCGGVEFGGLNVDCC